MVLRRRSTRPLRGEALEDRALLAVTAAEQYFVYRINYARNDPVRYQTEQSLSVDLAYVTPRPPLAVNAALFNSSEAKVNDMATNNYFAHQSPSGVNANRLVRNNSYALPQQLPSPSGGFFWVYDDSGNGVESLAAGYSTVDAALNGLIVDQGINPPGHRIHLLGIDEPNSLYRDIGVGYAFNAASTYDHYWAIHAAVISTTQSYATGVAYNDADGDGRMDLNEGLAGVTIQIPSLGLSTTTNTGGGWSLAVPNGSYTVQASGGGFTGSSSVNMTVAGSNVEVDFRSGMAGAQVNFVQVGGPVDPAPTVTSVTRLDADPAAGTSARFQVVFSESVTNVDAADFTVVKTGTANGAVSAVSGSGSTYQITVNTLSGVGTIGLGFAAGNNIRDVTSNALASTTPTTNELYTLQGTLTLTLPASIAENGGAQAGTATIARSGSTTASLVVSLVSSDTTEVRVPTTVTIPAGQTSVSFFLNAQDDQLLDGAQSATITASASGFASAARPLSVTDFEALFIAFTISTALEAGAGLHGAVSRGNTDTQAPLTVALTSANAAALVPATVVIPAGASFVYFALATPNNAALTGPQTFAISVSAAGFVGNAANVTIMDDEHIARWHNATEQADVDGRDGVDAQDVLYVVNELSVRQYSAADGMLTALSATPQLKLDLNADGYIDAQDVLYAVDVFARAALGGEGEAQDDWALLLATDLAEKRRRDAEPSLFGSHV